MQRNETSQTAEAEPDETESSAASGRIYLTQLARPGSNPREWTIRRIEKVVGSIA
jgi:hypothetical protein